MKKNYSVIIVLILAVVALFLGFYFIYTKDKIEFIENLKEINFEELSTQDVLIELGDLISTDGSLINDGVAKNAYFDMVKELENDIDLSRKS